MGYTMDQLDDLDALRARDAAQGRKPMTADDMRTGALNKLRTQAPRQSTREMVQRHTEASPKQVGLVMVLLRKLADHNPVIEATARAWWMERATVEDGRVVGTALTREQVSDTINRLRKHLEAPAKPVQLVADEPTTPVAPVTTPAPIKPAYDPYDDITDGNYAITDEDGKNWFYRISRKEGKGQYKGRTFINVQMRVSDDLIRVYGGWSVKRAILDKIRTAGVDAAHLAYATLLGRCWHCHASLTDNVGNPYFELGLGPVCGDKA